VVWQHSLWRLLSLVRQRLLIVTPQNPCTIGFLLRLPVLDTFLSTVERLVHPTEKKQFPQESAAFEKSGLYVLRKSENDFCVFRCGTAPDRFGQADQLHVDLFWDGNNILTDGGSYLYNDELHFHQYFMGTSSHNTIVIDDQDQMLLWRRFKWLYKTQALIIEKKINNNIISGYHSGYKRIEKGIIHKRYVKFNTNYLLVRDQIKKNQNSHRKIALNWHVNSDKIIVDKVNGNHEIKFNLNGKTYYLYFWMHGKNGFNQPKIIEGWMSRYFGQKENLKLLQFELTTKTEIQFVSLFTKSKMTVEERIACASF